MSLKSISPFIASVLLISFTIASGIIVYYFLTTLPKVQTTEVSSQASKVLSCAGATFDVKVRNCNLLNGLVLWLRMDEGSGNITYDYSGYGNNGTLYNGTTICGGIDACPLWVDGKFGKALSFDGVDDYVTAGPSSLLNQAALGYTVVVWFKASIQNEWWKGIVGKPGRNYNIWLGGANGGSPYIYHRFHTTAYWDDGCPNLGGIIWNDWNFVAITHDGSTCRTYIKNNNGEFQTQANTAPLIADDTALQIGRNLDGGWGNFFNGTIDEVRIYNRALSEEEIKELYYNGLTNKFNITVGLLNFGYADLGNSFNAIVYLKNGTILQLPLILNRDLIKGSYLEKTLTIDSYYPSYGLVDKIMVCSNDCQGVCYEVNVNNQC